MTERSSVPSWQHRIGGRWAISLESYLVGAVLNIAILALTGGQIGADEVKATDIGRWVLLGVVTALVVGAYALAADASIFKHRRERPVSAWLVIAFHLGVGLIFGVAVVFGGDRWIEPSAQDPFVRIAVIALIGLWWGISAALVLEARDRFNHQREVLIEQAVEIELATISETEAADRLRSTIAREAGPAFEATREQLSDVMTSLASPTPTLLPIEDWWHASQSLRSAADATIRPLSHQLWAATSRQYPRPRLGRVLTRLVLYQQFAVLPTMTILAIGYLPAGTYRFGLVGGTLATIAMTLGAGALLVGGNALMRRFTRLNALFAISTFIASQVYAIAYLAALSAIAQEPFTINLEVLGGVIAISNSVLLPAAYASLNGARDEVIDRFRLDTDRARMRQLANAQRLAQATRQAARDLHGTVQTRLIACAVAIEQAARSGDIVQFRQALELSLAILDAPLPSGEADDSATLRDEVSRMCAPWDGLCIFDVRIDPAVGQMRGPVAMAAGRIVEEAVANACRHGLAEAVNIRIDLTDGAALRFTIDDNGCGPTGGGPGIGTAMLAGLSQGQVSLRARPEGGARLQVLLPVDAAPGGGLSPQNRVIT